MSGKRASLALSLITSAAIAVALGGCSSGHSKSKAGPHKAAPPDSAIQISPGAQPIQPNVPVVVWATYGKLASVAMTAADGSPVAGTLSADKRAWTSTQPLGYGASYTVRASGTGNDGTMRQTFAVSTAKPHTTSDIDVFPDGHDLTSVGVGQPIKVTFDEKVTNRAAAERALRVVTDPPLAGAWRWYSSREVHWRPMAYWPAGTKVTLDAKLFGVDLGNGVFGKKDRTVSFGIHDAWVAKADGNSHHMQIFQNGNLVRDMPIAMGRPKYPTQEGAHVVQEKYRVKIMDSRSWGLALDAGGYRTPVEWATRISGDGEFVHSAPWSVDDQGHSNVSHGCVNVSPSNAIWFYNTFSPGDIVEITNTGRHYEDSAWDDWSIPWDQWLKGSAITT
jgi:lipoprotein-anchoring transpeptidase ErfK/SrfK